MEFEYTAIDNQGSRHQGVVTAQTKIQVQQKLLEQGLNALSITPIAKEDSASSQHQTIKHPVKS